MNPSLPTRTSVTAMKPVDARTTLVTARSSDVHLRP